MITLLLAASLSLTTPAAAMPTCTGPDRAARKLTCLVDGDTGWERGVKWRLLDIDTPEIDHAACPAERAIGKAARKRLAELMGGRYTIADSGKRDRSGRVLARVVLADGSDAGSALIAEGLAQPWPNKGNVWCGVRG